MPFAYGSLTMANWGDLVFDLPAAPSTPGPIQPAFLALLNDSANVTAIAASRIYIGAAPQDERRARVIITGLDEDDNHTIAEHGGYVTGRIQIICAAPVAKDAALLAAAARLALDSHSGLIADCYVDWIKCGGARELPALPLEGKAVPTFAVSMDCTFMYHLSAPV